MNGIITTTLVGPVPSPDRRTAPGTPTAKPPRFGKRSFHSSIGTAAIPRQLRIYSASGLRPAPNGTDHRMTEHGLLCLRLEVLWCAPPTGSAQRDRGIRRCLGEAVTEDSVRSCRTTVESGDTRRRSPARVAARVHSATLGCTAPWWATMNPQRPSPDDVARAAANPRGRLRPGSARLIFLHRHLVLAWPAASHGSVSVYSKSYAPA
ncbi:hypothetical protein GCM10020229_38570 [Kitasatospora albolonga]